MVGVTAWPSDGQQGANPVPYQRGPPQEYLEAVTNKRLTEEVISEITDSLL